MENSIEKINTNRDGDDLFSYAMQLVTSTSLAMVLVNVVKLQILETIAEAGPDARLSAQEIVSRLSIPNRDAPTMVDRMLCLLASYSIVTCTIEARGSEPVKVYGLAPVAKYFVRNEDGVSLGPLLELLQDKVYIGSWFKLKDAVMEGGIPFNMVHGTHAFDYPSMDERYNEVFNKAMINHTTIVIKEILKFYHGFDNLKRVVDVGGGLGITLNLIRSKHSAINGINFDLPHVIRHAPIYPGIEHVGGDMFEEVPQGDAIFMKWILHDWSDAHCLKLLKNCYKALPEGGKVIAVDAILSIVPNTDSSTKVNMQTDAIMMTQDVGGKERTENEFLALAKGAGFSGMKKAGFVCNFWVMEFYK